MLYNKHDRRWLYFFRFNWILMSQKLSDINITQKDADKHPYIEWGSNPRS